MNTGLTDLQAALRSLEESLAALRQQPAAINTDLLAAALPTEALAA